MKIYIVGPMSGIPDWNFPAFDAAEKRWREAGHIPVSPAAIDRLMGIDPKMVVAPEEIPKIICEAMERDLVVIRQVDALALIPGWEFSSGATVEVAYAQYLACDFYGAVTMKQIYPPTKPWQY